MWLSMQMQSMPKMKLSYYARLNCVRFVTKTRQDNDVIDHISVVYAKIEIEPPKPI